MYLAAQNKGKIAHGLNPQSEKREIRAEMTLKELFDQYMNRYSKVHKKSWKYDEREITRFLDYAHEKGICRKDDKLSGFIESARYVYNRVKIMKFKEFQNLYKYIEGYTPFSTQHKIKGREFDNVLVILDNGNWTMFSYEYLLENNGTDTVRNRTQKLFYVCCTRAKENLVVYVLNPIPLALTKAKEWFGEDNVVKVSG